MKDRQSAKIREIGDALLTSGCMSIGQQAAALGVSRSTAWSVHQADHKSTGLTPILIKRMMASPKLPAAVRQKIVEYAAEKAAGVYGHGARERRRFQASLLSAQISGSVVPDVFLAVQKK
jgi:hypothetical protein